MGAVSLSRKRYGKNREMPGFSVNPDFFTRLLEEYIVKIKETDLRESMKNRNRLFIAFKCAHFPNDILPLGLFIKRITAP